MQLFLLMVLIVTLVTLVIQAIHKKQNEQPINIKKQSNISNYELIDGFSPDFYEYEKFYNSGWANTCKCKSCDTFGMVAKDFNSSVSCPVCSGKVVDSTPAMYNIVLKKWIIKKDKL